ncbi:hypothetical protein C8F04DRAFT_1298347 [Mycena alexandri]|uniref:Uncharacterized protein n=1 Tax=Mycena alexandri TaxID=1745969 RepID=A0AAD6SDN9_9AGAR|nr:hypothetical protein C8F04DRAFT_1298347 [Mycena alexandri]
MARSKALTNAAEVNHKLQEQLAAAQAEISQYKQREAARRKATTTKNLIARPHGQPGRDYNLQTEMRLAKDTVHFRRLHASELSKVCDARLTYKFRQRIVKDRVHQELDVSTTISKQDKTRVDATVIKIGKIAPYFRRFAGLWPVRNMIRTYLLNMQNRRRTDLESEKEWTEDNANGVDPDEEEREGDADEDKQAEADDEDVDEQSGEEDATGKGEGEGEYSDEEDEEISILAKRKAPVSAPKTTKAALKNNTASGQKRKAADPPADASAAKKHKPAPSTPKRSPPSRAKNPTAKVLTWADVPAECPAVLCEDDLPAEQNDRLLALFQRLEDLCFNVGPQGRGVSLLHLEICAAITEEKKKANYLRIGAHNEWPLDIDFAAVVPRILELKETVLDMFRDPEILWDCPIFQHFLRNINHKLFLFCKSESKANFKKAVLGRRCGYYGPKGDDEDDAVTYELHRKNIRAMKGGTNHIFSQAFPYIKLDEKKPKPKTEKAPRPQGLSLLDFEEPNPNPKKRPVPKPKNKVVTSAEAKKENTAPAFGGYGLRSQKAKLAE